MRANTEIDSERKSVTFPGVNLKDTNKVLDDGFTLFCEVPMR